MKPAFRVACIVATVALFACNKPVFRYEDTAETRSHGFTTKRVAIGETVSSLSNTFALTRIEGSNAFFTVRNTAKSEEHTYRLGSFSRFKDTIPDMGEELLFEVNPDHVVVGKLIIRVTRTNSIRSATSVVK